MDDGGGVIERATRFVQRNAWWILILFFVIHVHAHIWSDLHREAVRHERKARKCIDDDEFYAMYESDCTDAIIAANKWTFLNAILEVITLCWLETVLSSWFSTTFFGIVLFVVLVRLVPGLGALTSWLLHALGIVKPSAQAPQLNVDFASIIDFAQKRHAE